MLFFACSSVLAEKETKVLEKGRTKTATKKNLPWRLAQLLILSLPAPSRPATCLVLCLHVRPIPPRPNPSRPTACPARHFDGSSLQRHFCGQRHTAPRSESNAKNSTISKQTSPNSRDRTLLQARLNLFGARNRSTCLPVVQQ